MTGGLRRLSASIPHGQRVQFLYYSVAVALILEVCVRFCLPSAEFGEARDQRFFLLLPFVFECSFLIALALSHRNGSCREDSASSLFQQPTLLSVVLNLLPIILGCVALLPKDLLSYSSLLLVTGAGLIQFAWVKLRGWKLMKVLQWIIAIVIVGATIKAQLLLAWKCPWHWSHYLAPLSAYREGGILLWDTPSQYGFLNIIVASVVASLISLPPVEALGWLFTAFSVVAVVICIRIFYKYLSLCPILSAGFASCLICAIPGISNDLSGPIAYPSVSAYRFLPSFLAVYSSWRASQSRSKSTLMAAGILGAIACLWSGESLAYTILPLGFFVLIKALTDRDILFVLQPPCISLLLTAFASMAFLVGYSLKFGIVVEPMAMFEYSLAYANANSAVLVDFTNSWTVYFVFSLALCYFLFRKATLRSGGSRAGGALFFGFMLCVSTYFIAKSDESNVLNLMPWGILAIAMAGAMSTNSETRQLARGAVFVVSLLTIQYFSMPDKARARGQFLARLSAPSRLVLPDLPEVPDTLQRYIGERWPGYGVTVLDNEFATSKPLKISGTTGYRLSISTEQHFNEVPSLERRRTYVHRIIERNPKSLVITPSEKSERVKTRFMDWVGLCTLSEVGDYQGWKIFEVKKT
jgi:hypothetical protein